MLPRVQASYDLQRRLNVSYLPLPLKGRNHANMYFKCVNFKEISESALLAKYTNKEFDPQMPVARSLFEGSRTFRQKCSLACSKALKQMHGSNGSHSACNSIEIFSKMITSWPFVKTLGVLCFLMPFDGTTLYKLNSIRQHLTFYSLSYSTLFENYTCFINFL